MKTAHLTYLTWLHKYRSVHLLSFPGPFVFVQLQSLFRTRSLSLMLAQHTAHNNLICMQASPLIFTSLRFFWPQQAHNAVIVPFAVLQGWLSEERAPGYTWGAFMLTFLLRLWWTFFSPDRPAFPVSVIPPLRCVAPPSHFHIEIPGILGEELFSTDLWCWPVLWSHQDSPQVWFRS